MILIVKPAARSDILRQISYYGELDRPDVAHRFIGAVELSFDTIIRMPLAGSPKYFEHQELQGLRTWSVKGFDDFRIYYLIQGDSLVILRILHGRRDIDGIFENFDDADH